MTFLEAALEVLRHEKGPLHFSDIAKRAVDRRLLSHVGRDPETAMRTCLNSAVRNASPDTPFQRTKPGHYQIRPGVKLPEPPPLPPQKGEPEEEEMSGSKRSSTAKKVSRSKKKASTSKVSSRAKTATAKTASKTRSRKKVATEKSPKEELIAAEEEREKAR